jgi:hypothetical protein
MKRTANIFGLLILAGLLAGVASAQEGSLADAARLHKRQQEGKPVATKVFTNDNLPTTESISTVGAPPSDTTSDSATNSNPPAASDAPKLGPDGKPIDPAKERQKTWEDWGDKIQKQKATVEQMKKDNEEMEKQYRQATGGIYDNAANRANGGAQWAQGEGAAFREKMEQKTKALEEAKQKIDDLQEEARKAGVPAGFRD